MSAKDIQSRLQKLDIKLSLEGCDEILEMAKDMEDWAMITIKLDKEYEKALQAINDDHYNHPKLDDAVKDLIEEYLLRENGRLGQIVNGRYKDD